MDVLSSILLILCVILIGIIVFIKRQIQDICRQLSFLEEQESNMLITTQTVRFGIGNLVERINQIILLNRKQRKEYLDKEQRVQQVYTNLSHDIRTPLTSLDGYVQLLAESEDKVKQKEYLTIVRERISSLKDMLEELFTFTRLKDESYQLELSKVCVSRLLKETVFSYYDDWSRQGIEPQFSIEEGDVFIEGNVSALSRIFQNIIKNGLVHGEKSIIISLTKTESEVILSFGNAMKHPEDVDVSQVFERFYKADKSRSRNSTGLGLSIAKSFVERMNGTIEARLENGQFVIFLKFPMSISR